MIVKSHALTWWILRSIANTLHMHPTLKNGRADIMYVIYRYTFISQAQDLSMKLRFYDISQCRCDKLDLRKVRKHQTLSDVIEIGIVRFALTS